jgi:hypothetical protein
MSDQLSKCGSLKFYKQEMNQNRTEENSPEIWKMICRKLLNEDDKVNWTNLGAEL